MRICAGFLLFLIPVFVGPGCGPEPRPIPPPSLDLRPSVPPPPGTGDTTRSRFPWPLPVDAAERILLETTLFEFGGMPEKRQVYAFNVVFEQPDALARFRKIASLGRPAGRLYALCALQELSPADSVAVGTQVAELEDQILVGDHDFYRSQAVRHLVEFVVARRLGAEFQQSRIKVEEHFKRTFLSGR